MKRFRGGLVFRVHRLLHQPTLGLRVIKKKKKGQRRFEVEIFKILEVHESGEVQDNLLNPQGSGSGSPVERGGTKREAPELAASSACFTPCTSGFG